MAVGAEALLVERDDIPARAIPACFDVAEVADAPAELSGQLVQLHSARFACEAKLAAEGDTRAGGCHGAHLGLEIAKQPTRFVRCRRSNGEPGANPQLEGVVR
jgi:hypothetical protein